MDEKKIRKRILAATLTLIRNNGSKFTMDDLAAELGMSKKSIYVIYRDKESLLLDTVDMVFDGIKEGEEEIYSNTDLSLTERIREILGSMPEAYRGFDFTKFYEVKKKYPEVYQRVKNRLESGWERTLDLIREGMEIGLVRKDVNLFIFQLTYQAALERFLMGDELEKAGMDYMDAFHALVKILVDGIILPEGDTR